MKTDNKKVEKSDRFAYADDEGLAVVSKGDDTKTESKKKETEDKPIKKGGFEQWLS